jgi:hypothetical protein
MYVLLQDRYSLLRVRGAVWERLLASCWTLCTSCAYIDTAACGSTAWNAEHEGESSRMGWDWNVGQGAKAALWERNEHTSIDRTSLGIGKHTTVCMLERCGRAPPLIGPCRCSSAAARRSSETASWNVACSRWGRLGLNARNHHHDADLCSPDGPFGLLRDGRLGHGTHLPDGAPRAGMLLH